MSEQIKQAEAVEEATTVETTEVEVTKKLSILGKTKALIVKHPVISAAVGLTVVGGIAATVVIVKGNNEDQEIEGEFEEIIESEFDEIEDEEELEEDLNEIEDEEAEEE